MKLKQAVLTDMDRYTLKVAIEAVVLSDEGHTFIHLTYDAEMGKNHTGCSADYITPRQ